MQRRKEKEIQHYDKAANRFENRSLSLFSLGSYAFLRSIFNDNYGNVLDYGCGTGVHSQWLKEHGERVMGVDLSQKSINFARKKVEGVEFLVKDCEETGFDDNYFDMVFDGGTFSSLDLNKAIKEIVRILKPNGTLVGIETLGHNPLLNLKRRINRLIGKRTKWATEHILKTKDFEMIKNHFSRAEAHFFHLVSWLAFPFLKYPGGKFFLRFLEKIDIILISLFPFLEKHSFKIVFILSNPKKK